MEETKVFYRIELAKFDLDNAVWQWLPYLKEDYETEEQAIAEIEKIDSAEFVFRIKQVTITTAVIPYLRKDK